jgi:hypothetical protein
MERTAQVTREIRVSPIPLASDLVRTLRGPIETLAGRHHLEGAATSGPEPLVLFQLPATVPPRFRPDGDLRHVLVWAWPGDFGASFTITVEHVSGVKGRAWFPRGAPVLDLIRGGNFKVVLVRGTRPIAAYTVDFASSEIARNFLHERLDAVSTACPTIVTDMEAHYWEVVDCLTDVFRDQLTAADHLSLGWYDSLARLLSGYRRWMDDLRSRIGMMLARLEQQEIPASWKPLYRVVLESGSDLGAIHAYMRDKLSDNLDDLWKLFEDWIRMKCGSKPQEWRNTPGLPAEDWNELASLVRGLLEAYVVGSKATQCGKHLVWYNPRRNTLQRMQIEPRMFPDQCAPRDYWSRLPCHILHSWGQLIGGVDFPFDPCLWTSNLAQAPVADNVEASLSAGCNLLAEARANKTGTIPPAATVELRVGPFEYVELTEVWDSVQCVFRTDDGCFGIGYIEPGEGEEANRGHSFPLPGKERGLDEELMTRIDAGLFLLISAIVRDFWVVENRETVFGHRIQRSFVPRRRGEDDKPRLVYPPRVRYLEPPNVQHANSQLAYKERRLHSVRAHLRRVAGPSEHQLDLARRYGIEVPVGYTFVSPHERGKSKREIIYRSRSALKCLYSVVSEAPGKEPARWFQFERDVHDLMKSLGFEVQHVSASRKGDNGVDVYAVKGTDLEEVRWVIQCKCWSPKRKVTPSTVRDLVGALRHYPPGTRGMIVTTSGFTSGAKTEAETAGIKLIDGEEFHSRVESLRTEA